jgi:hypothetical protein
VSIERLQIFAVVPSEGCSFVLTDFLYSKICIGHTLVINGDLECSHENINKEG